MDLWRGISRRLTDSPERRYSEEDYELLATDSTSRVNGISSTQRRRRSKFQRCLHHLTLRRILMFLAMIPFFLVLGVLWSGIPPNYEDVRKFERSLPQHNLTRARTEHGRYLRFPDHLWGHGLNNILQEA
jgi:hypothetical protein